MLHCAFPFSSTHTLGSSKFSIRTLSHGIIEIECRSIIIDYIPTHRLPKTRVLFWWGLRLATVVVGVGLYEFETNDVGVTEAIKRIWKA